MRISFGRAALAAMLAAPLALGGCAADAGYGLGYASNYYDDGFGGYGHGGLGYGNGPYGGSYGAGSGWFNDFYYPGTGVYVIDRGGRRHRWNDDQRRHWGGRGDGPRPGYGRPGGSRPGYGRPGVGRPDGVNPGRPDRGPRPDGIRGDRGPRGDRQGIGSGGRGQGGRGFGGRGGPSGGRSAGRSNGSTPR